MSFLENQTSWEGVWGVKRKVLACRFEPCAQIRFSGSSGSGNPEKPDFSFFSIYWRTRLGRRVFGVSKEASWPPGSNRIDGPGFPVHPDPEIRKNRIGVFGGFLENQAS